MRLYSFVNFYLSSIQQGIQTGHMTDEMSVKYLLDASGAHGIHTFKEWLRNHKTYIILNGGESSDIYETSLMLTAYGIQLNLPTASFNEPGCNDMKTCCGIVVPEKYYGAYDYRKHPLGPVDATTSFFWHDEWRVITEYVEGTPEWELITLLKSRKLAQ